MHPRIWKISVCALLAVLSAACYYQKHLMPSELEGIRERPVVITMKDGSAIHLYKARVENDNLIGDLDTFKTAKSVKVPLVEVNTISIEEFDTVKAISHFVAAAIPLIGILSATAWLDKKIARAPVRPPVSPISCCPFIYSYDGKQFVFDAEPYGGAISQGLERTEWCRLDYLKDLGGRYKLLVRNELDETQYTDELALVVVDHPPGTVIVPEIQGRMHTFSAPSPPRRATDQNGRDLLPLVSRNDGRVWQSDLEGRDPDRKEDAADELTFEFSKPASARTVKLVVNARTTFQGAGIAKAYLGLFGEGLDAWYREIDRIGPANREVWKWYFDEGLFILKIEVETKDGWKPRGMLYGGGPFIVKDRSYVLDIQDVPDTTLRIRLKPAVGFWLFDRLGAEYGEDAPLDIAEIRPVASGGKEADSITSLLAKADRRYNVLSEIGAAVELDFPAPPPKPGFDRTVFLKARGYYKVHLQTAGKPQIDLLGRIFHEPGFAAQYALKTFLGGATARPGRH